MGLDVTLYGYVVNRNEFSSRSSSGCGIDDIWIWGFVFGSRLNFRSLIVFKKRNISVVVDVVAVKIIAHIMNGF